ncbi:MAG: alpha/beta hydrolase [Alcanivoracaceae bacterium]|nr:alpha/beta hydrolase [Alcanivoracaceae bacterium]
MPFNVERIRQSWEPLAWEAPQAISGEAHRYARFYGIDFANQFPDLLHAFGYFEAAGHTIAVHAWRPAAPRGSVLVCHGYFDHVGLFRHVIRHLLELNYAVLAYDLPGHGLSSGPQAAIEDFAIYREVLSQCLANKANSFPKPWHVIAQSTGGAIIMDYALHGDRTGEPFPFEKMILLAPLVRPANWRYGAALHSIVRPFRDYVRRSFQINSSDPEFRHFLQHQDPLQSQMISARWVSALKRWIPDFERASRVKISPIIIQGDLDETVDWRHNLNVIEDKFSSPEIHLLSGARHQLANESPAFREKINRILDKHLA